MKYLSLYLTLTFLTSCGIDVSDKKDPQGNLSQVVGMIDSDGDFVSDSEEVEMGQNPQIANLNYYSFNINEATLTSSDLFDNYNISENEIEQSYILINSPVARDSHLLTSPLQASIKINNKTIVESNATSKDGYKLKVEISSINLVDLNDIDIVACSDERISVLKKVNLNIISVNNGFVITMDFNRDQINNILLKSNFLTVIIKEGAYNNQIKASGLNRSVKQKTVLHINNEGLKYTSLKSIVDKSVNKIFLDADVKYENIEDKKFIELNSIKNIQFMAEKQVYEFHFVKVSLNHIRLDELSGFHVESSTGSCSVIKGDYLPTKTIFTDENKENLFDRFIVVNNGEEFKLNKFISQSYETENGIVAQVNLGSFQGNTIKLKQHNESGSYVNSLIFKGSSAHCTKIANFGGKAVGHYTLSNRAFVATPQLYSNHFKTNFNFEESLTGFLSIY